MSTETWSTANTLLLSAPTGSLSELSSFTLIEIDNQYAHPNSMNMNSTHWMLSDEVNVLSTGAPSTTTNGNEAVMNTPTNPVS